MLCLSIVIPTIGRPEYLLNTLKDLCAQDVGNWECLIIAQYDIDPLPFFNLPRRNDIKIRIFICKEPNASLARNIGLLEARAEIILFLDDDLNIPNRSFLKAHLQNYEEPSVNGVSGQILDIQETLRTTRHRWSYRRRVGWLYFPSNYDKRCAVKNGSSANLSVRRDLAISVGGMDEQFEKGAHREESDFCLRFVERFGKFIYDPSASVIHLAVPTGGCRTWGPNHGIHPVHHVTGEWYFILKNFKEKRILLCDLPDHLFCLFRKQIWNRQNKWKIGYIKASLQRCFEGYQNAKQKLQKGPKYISSQRTQYKIFS